MEITNEMVNQYLPLVKKLTLQYKKYTTVSQEDIESMAWEGLILAFHNYDKTRSNLTFLQYAAFSIRNNILTGINTEARIVKISKYGQALYNKYNYNYNIKSITTEYSNNYDEIHEKSLLNKYTTNIIISQDLENFYNILERTFPPKTINIFYTTYGIKGHLIEKTINLAKKYNISPSAITQSNKKVINFIKKRDDLKNIIYNNLAVI